MPVPDFSVGEVFTAAAADRIGLWLVKTQTVASAVASVTVPGAFSSSFDNYYIMWTGGTISTAAAVNLQLGPSSVANYNTGYWGNQANASSIDTIQYLGFDNQAEFQNVGMGDTNGASLFMEIFEPQKARFTLAKTSWIDTRTTFGWSQGGAVHRVASAFTDFKISPSAGTLSGGTIRVYGYRD